MLPRNRKPTHPGEMLLLEFLTPMGITQKEFADHIGWTQARLSELIHAKRGVTVHAALSLGDAFSMEPEFWLNLQRNWDLWQAEKGRQRIKALVPARSNLIAA